MPASSRCRFRRRSRRTTVRRATKARCVCARLSRATAPSSNGRLHWILRRRMPRAGARYFSHGFRTGLIRWHGRWIVVRPDLALLVEITLRTRATKDLRAFCRQIRLQHLPRHEGDVLAFGIGADGIGRIVEGEAGALAAYRRWRERHRADLE